MPSFKKSVAVRNASLDAEETAIGTAPLLRLYEFVGAYPVDAAAAIAGTQVGGITLPTDWLAAAASGAKARLGTWTGAMTATARLHYARLYDSAGTTCHYQFALARPHAVSTAYVLGDRVTNAGNLYRATVAGTTGAASAPTHTSGAVADGGVTWTFEDTADGVIVPDTYSGTNAQPVSVGTFTITAGNA